MTKPSVGVVYHFFAHYRDPILKELSSSSLFDYWFVGDRTDPNNAGIRNSLIINHPHFVYAPCHFKGDYLFQESVLQFALRKDIDAIIYLGVADFISTWLSASLARLTGKKVYFWSHGWTHRDSWIKNIIRCNFYRLASGGLLLYGVRARKIGVKKGFDPDRLYVIYNSLDYELCKRIRQEIIPAELTNIRCKCFSKPDRPMVICTSRLIPARRMDLLLDALGILKGQGYEINATIVGEGTEKEALEKQAQGIDLPIIFLGECYDENLLARLYKASDATVIPGYCGLTAIHSLGYGIPVITNDDPELNAPEWEAVQPGVNGDVFRYGDATSLAEKIYQWTQLSKPEKADISSRCIQSIERHYTPEAQRKAIENALSGMPARIDE